jgi:serine/threonine-protein kinase
MSPEQARGERVDTRTDIFSFGIVMFEMFSGHLPFIGANSVALLHNLHFSPPRDLRQLRPGVPKPLIALISRMLEKDIDKRVQTMGEVGSELRQGAAGLVDGPVTWHPSDATIDMAAPKFQKKRFSPWQIWLFAVLLVALILAGIGGWHWHRKSQPIQQAGGNEMPVEGNAYALYQRARQDLDHWDRDGSVDNAIKIAERAVQLDPQSAASYAALGEAYYLKNRANPDPQWMKLASENANKAVALDNYLAAGHVSLGLVKMELGDSAGAEKELHTASDLDPKSAVPHRWLARVYDRNGKLDEGMKELTVGGKLNPSDWQLPLESGMNAYAGGNYKLAAAAWEQTLLLEPDSVQVLRNLGGAYHMLGRDDDAIAALQHAIEVKPNPDVYSNLGTILFYQGKYDESVPAFEKAVALSANNFETWGNLGDAYRWSSGKKDKAKAAYQQAIQLVREEIVKSPKQADLKADLAIYLAKSGNKSAALQTMEPVNEARSKDPTVLYDSAVVYELCGQRDKALNSLLAAVHGGEDLNDIKNEPEFVSLRADPRYHLQILNAATKPSP